MFVVNKTTNDVIGYTITNTTLTTSQDTSSYHVVDSSAQLLWRVHIPNDQQIIEVKSHHNHGNSVLYTLVI